MKNDVDETLYPDGWSKIHQQLEARAGLEIINMNHVHRTSISKVSVDQKTRLLQKIDRNQERLKAYFNEHKVDGSAVPPSEDMKLLGRRLWRQYVTYAEMLEGQIAMINSWLSTNPPF